MTPELLPLRFLSSWPWRKEQKTSWNPRPVICMVSRIWSSEKTNIFLGMLKGNSESTRRTCLRVQTLSNPAFRQCQWIQDLSSISCMFTLQKLLRAFRPEPPKTSNNFTNLMNHIYTSWTSSKTIRNFFPTTPAPTFCSSSPDINQLLMLRLVSLLGILERSSGSDFCAHCWYHGGVRKCEESSNVTGLACCCLIGLETTLQGESKKSLRALSRYLELFQASFEVSLQTSHQNQLLRMLRLLRLAGLVVRPASFWCFYTPQFSLHSMLGGFMSFHICIALKPMNPMATELHLPLIQHNGMGNGLA